MRNFFSHFSLRPVVICCCFDTILTARLRCLGLGVWNGDWLVRMRSWGFGLVGGGAGLVCEFGWVDSAGAGFLLGRFGFGGYLGL